MVSRMERRRRLQRGIVRRSCDNQPVLMDRQRMRKEGESSMKSDVLKWDEMMG